VAYTQAMTFAEICSEVQSLRFNSSQSSSIQRWVNDRYAALWNADEWIFKYAKANVTVTAGSNTVTALPADFGIALGMWRADGQPLSWMPPKDFENFYQGSSDTGGPGFFTIINQTVLVGPTSNETSSTYLLLYEKRMTPLVADGDIPAIPAQHHYLLVTGALALGLALFNDFTFQFLETVWQQGIAEMRQEWLADQRGQVGQWGRDNVESLPSYWGV
jgi:hypothetical protein